jgi:hypothetical protein
MAQFGPEGSGLFLNKADFSKVTSKSRQFGSCFAHNSSNELRTCCRATRHLGSNLGRATFVVPPTTSWTKTSFGKVELCNCVYH